MQLLVCGVDIIAMHVQCYIISGHQTLHLLSV